MPTNLTATLYERAYFASQDRSVPRVTFQPYLPTTPVSPAAPAYPATLNSIERMEVDRWLTASTQDRPFVLTRTATRAAIAKIGEYVAYYADPAIQAWLEACLSAISAQWKYNEADAAINNKATVSKSSNGTGAGSTPPPATQPPGTNV